MTSDDASPADAPYPNGASPSRSSEARLAEALRANLRRRKQGPPSAQPDETPPEIAAP